MEMCATGCPPSAGPHGGGRSLSAECAAAFSDAAEDYVAQADAMLPAGAGGERRRREVVRLACDLAVADRIEADGSLLRIGVGNLDRWRLRNGGVECQALAEWRGLLASSPLRDLLALLRGADEVSMRLRRSTPFPGVLSQWERRLLHAKAGFGAYPAG